MCAGVYPIPGYFMFSRPACGEDIWIGGKVYGFLEPQQGEVIIHSLAVIFWVFLLPSGKIIREKFQTYHIYYSRKKNILTLPLE